MLPVAVFSPYERILIPSGTEVLVAGRKQVCSEIHGTVKHVMKGYMEIVEGLLIVHPTQLAVISSKGQEVFIPVTEEIALLNRKKNTGE